MAATTAVLASLNAGEISPLALARVDLQKLRVACAVKTNWLDHSLGPTMVRPGLGMIQEVPGDAEGWFGEFVYDTITALLVATAAGLQPLVDDAWIVRPAVATAITNGTFATDLSGWTQSDEAGAVSQWAAGPYMELTGTGANYAWRDQEVTVSGGDTGTEHGIRLVVAHGNVALLIGTSQGDGSYWNVTLRPGTYSFSFTPSGSFWIRLGAGDAFPALVSSIAVEGPGAVSVPVPWSAGDFGVIRYAQSANVLFVACDGYQQREIIRFVTSVTDTEVRSWGVALYQTDDGPFMAVNTSQIMLTPSGVDGSITLTASRALFQAGHVGALFQLTQTGQTAIATLAGSNQFTGTIRVSGLSSKNPGDPGTSSRLFAITTTGTWSGILTLQYSLGSPGAWVDAADYSTNVTLSYDDGLDNQIVYYRIGFRSGSYTSGSAGCTLWYQESVQTGIVRITAVADGTSATADVLTQLGAAAVSTNDWSEGEWSSYRGFPAAVELHEGRVFWGGPTIDIDGSISDDFTSYDATVTGDSGPIDETLAGKPRWLLSLQRLIVGTVRPIISIRASALDEPLTPTAFVQRQCADRGAAPVRPLRIDQQGIFIGRDGRIYELDWTSVGNPYVDYSTRDLTQLHPEVALAGVVDAAVRRNPDTTMFFPLADGTAVGITYNKEQDVLAITPLASPGGVIERVGVLPAAAEDGVYFLVNRTIGGTTKRFIEKMAKRTECTGGVLNKVADCFTIYSGAPTNVLSGLSYLNGQQVVVWADGGALVVAQSAMLTVAGGSITLPNGYEASNAVIGLPYTAELETAKLAFGSQNGGALAEQKRVASVGLVMMNVCPVGVRLGRDFSHLSGLPSTYRGKPLTPNQVFDAYDARPSAFAGAWDSDSRVCVRVQAPYPCTLQALALWMATNEPDDTPPPSPGSRG